MGWFLRFLFSNGKNERLENRRSARHSIDKASNLYATNRPTSVLLVDISLHGARICNRFPREAATEVALELVVDNVAMRLPMRVVWDRYDDGWHEFGGDFQPLTPQQAEHLGQFVQRFAAEGRPLMEQRIA